MLKYNSIKYLFKIFDNKITGHLNEKVFKKNSLRKLNMMYSLLQTRSATMLFTEYEKSRMLKDYRYNPYDFTDELYRKYFSNKGDLLNRMLYTDIKTWMVDDLLMKADKMTMANSLEVRVPFLDHNLAEYAFKIDARWKIKNNISKYILKKTFENKLPYDLVYRKKMGFPVPWSC
jgi:asparagine synthase (glutamine-hydrolysing)